MKNRSLMWATLGWALMPLLSAVAPALAQSSAETELLELNRQLFETLILEQDPTFLRSVSDESYVVIAPGGVIESRERVIAGLGAFAAGEIDLGPMSVMTVFGQGGDDRWSVVSRALSTGHPAALERGIC